MGLSCYIIHIYYQQYLIFPQNIRVLDTSRICKNNVITQKLAFLCYYPQKITLFFLNKLLNHYNYTLKNGYQGEPTTLHLYIKIMYIKNFFCLFWKVSVFELCRCSRIVAICNSTLVLSVTDTSSAWESLVFGMAWVITWLHHTVSTVASLGCKSHWKILSFSMLTHLPEHFLWIA